MLITVLANTAMVAMAVVNLHRLGETNFDYDFSAPGNAGTNLSLPKPLIAFLAQNPYARTTSCNRTVDHNNPHLLMSWCGGGNHRLVTLIGLFVW